MPILDDVASLRAENARLIALLDAHGIAWRVPHDAPKSLVSEPSRLSKNEKIALFRKLFRGRTDVYPVRWEGKTSGKTGYAPACGNDRFARNANLHGGHRQTGRRRFRPSTA